MLDRVVRASTKGSVMTRARCPGCRLRFSRAATATLSICPECGGVLSEHTEAGLTQWRCRVGHRYSPESLADAQAEDVEAALWAAVRALEDRQALLERMAAQRGRPSKNSWIGQAISDPEPDLPAFARSLGLRAAGPVTERSALPAAP